MTLYSRPEDSAGGGELSGPELESAVALLSHLETDQLEKMNEDETEMINIIDDSEIVKALQVEREDLVAANKSIAEFNVSLEPTLREKKELLRELYVTQGEIFASFDGKKQTLEKNTGATSLDTILAILQSEAATSDEASEELAESFLAGDLAPDEFLPQFRAKRKQTHAQRIKSEKFQELIDKGLENERQQQQQQQQQPQPPPRPQQQNNLSSNWNRSPTTSSRPSPHLPSPSRAAPAPPSYPPQPPAGYPVYNPGQGAAAAAPQPYWAQPQAPQPVMTGPPPGASNMPYPLSQPPPPHQGGPGAGPPRGGWGQGRAPYQMPYMAMPQPHMPGGYR